MSKQLSLCFALVLSAATPAFASEHFAGKTINMVVGNPPGGGYDMYARLIARHMGKFIPGRPGFIVQNMPGAGGAKAATFIYSIGPKDGTAIGAVSPGVVVGPLLDDRTKVPYDPTKLIYLGTANSSTRVCVTFSHSKIKTFADTQSRKTIIGAGNYGDSPRDYAHLHRNTAGAMFEIVTGYAGTPDILLAMERGEVDAVCGWDWASLKAQRMNLVHEKKINILVQVGHDQNRELTDMGVPSIWEFIKSDVDRKVTELVVAQQWFGRPFVVAPETPSDVVELLRKAFMDAMVDEGLLAEAERAKLDISAVDGKTIQGNVHKMYSAPGDIVEKAREAIRK